MVYYCNIKKEGKEYQRLENPQKSNPTIKTLERIANVYSCDLKISF